MYELAAWLQPLQWLVVPVGLFGLYALLSGAPRLPRRLALAGASLGTVSVILLLGLLLGLRGVYSGVGFSPLLQTASFLFYWGLPGGLMLAGIAAFWARGLGVWRFLPLAAGLFSAPLLWSLVFGLFVGESLGRPGQIEIIVVLARESPRLLSSAGWLLLGVVLYGAKNRDDRLLAKEQRELEKKNLALARRLYKEAWGVGELSVVDELVAESFYDRRRDQHGTEGFKRAISDLHSTFPDLWLSVEEQSAEGEEVTTRCTLSGTDRGGVLYYPPTERYATFSATYTDRFSEGKLVEHSGETEIEALLEQIGVRQPSGG